MVQHPGNEVFFR